MAEKNWIKGAIKMYNNPWPMFANTFSVLEEHGENVESATESSHFFERTYGMEKQGCFALGNAKEKEENVLNEYLSIVSAKNAAKRSRSVREEEARESIALSHAWRRLADVRCEELIILNGRMAELLPNDLIASVNTSN